MRVRGHAVATALTLLALTAGAIALAQAGRPSVALVEPGRHLFSGEQTNWTVLVQLPGEGVEDVELRWAAGVKDAVVLRGRKPLGRAVGEGRYDIRVIAPRVRARTDATLRLALWSKDAELAAASYPVSFWPPAPSWPKAMAGKKVAVFDPTGRTSVGLSYLGVAYEEVGLGWGIIPEDADLLVIGSGTSADLVSELLTDLHDRVTAGLTVLCLEGTTTPFTSEVAPTARPAASPPLDCSPPCGKPQLLEELVPADLGGWRGIGGPVLAPLEPPSRGNFRVLLDCPGADAADGSGVAALELFCGKGRYVLSQMRLAESFVGEPVARYALRNLVLYALSPWEPPNRTAGFLMAAGNGEEEEGEHAGPAEWLGLPASGLADPPQADLILIPADAESVTVLTQGLRTDLSKVLPEAVKGRDVMLIGLEPDTVDRFSCLWEGEVTLGTAAGEDEAGPAIRPDLCAGIRYADLESLLGRAALARITYRSPRGEETSADGLLAFAGRSGKVFVSQLPLPDGEEDDCAMRVYSQVLTNLDVRLEVPKRRALP
jgi:hypothetical protein